MTIKELKKIINNIDEKYDNEMVITDYKGYSEYCMGSSLTEVTGIEHWSSSGKGYYLLPETE